mgnify:CR=1 FL=1
MTVDLDAIIAGSPFGRFLNIGVEAYNFVSALNCILAQRLVRVICEHCKKPVVYPDSFLVESALSFFGVGVQPPEASWGSMLYQAQAAMSTEPWLALFPGACIVVTVGALTAASGRA